MPRATTSPRSKEAIDYLAFMDAVATVLGLAEPLVALNLL
jgi:hypothetical protein